MALELLTAGIQIKYAIEATAGTRPTASYTAIPSVKSIPGINTDVNTIDVTDLDQLVNLKYIAGLADSGGSLALTVNDTEAFRTVWKAMVAAYATAKGEGKGLWVEIAYPAASGFDSFYFPAEPVAYGFGGAEVNSPIENTANFVVAGDLVAAAAST